MRPNGSRPQVVCGWEVRTVNHRFFNASIKTPPGFDKYARGITDALKRHLSRGHVSVSLSVGRTAAAADAAPRVDLEKARGYHVALEALQEELDLPGSVDLEMLTRFGDLFRTTDQSGPSGIEPDMVEELVDLAATAARELREAEGLRLEEDLRERMKAISDQLDVVGARASERLLEHRDGLRDAVRELTEQVDVDEERLAREIAYLAERWDINEEIVRLGSHVELFVEALSADGSEPVGKRLGFLVQEMQREANTIGSKANDMQITQASVALKEEIERNSGAGGERRVTARAAPVLFAAPSGTGKTTLAVVWWRIPTGTSFRCRPRREPGERASAMGSTTTSSTGPAFEAMVEASELAEWADVHGELYGTPRAELDAAAERGEHVVLDIDVQGARQIRDAVPDARLIFVLPPDIDIMMARLSGRGTEAPAEIARRLQSALAELQAVPNFELRSRQRRPGPVRGDDSRYR